MKRRQINRRDQSVSKTFTFLEKRLGTLAFV
jgi:hypothetical protein